MKKLSPRRAVRSSSPKPQLVAAVIEALEERRMLAANLVISEFLASNTADPQKDHAGDHPDWIEIHNAGDATANLNDYFLTDDASDPEKWRFPAGLTLPAGGFQIVFADSSVNSVVSWPASPPSTPAGSEYHTNFSLSASGEYLGLINAADDSVQFAYAPTYPAQSTDVSYGLSNENDPLSAKAFFTTTTPGTTNTPSAVAATFSIPSETFTSTLHVTLSSTTPGAQIYYTINGALPSFNTTTGAPLTGTTLYSGILSLTNTTMLRTVVHATSYNASPVASQSYVALSTSTTTNKNDTNGTAVNVSQLLGTSTVGAFTSSLPIVTINTFNSTSLATDAGSISQTTDTGAIVSFTDTVSGTATLLGTPGYIGRAGVHVRGSTSSSYPKKQFSIELWDESNNDKKTSILGMPSDSDWVLYAPYTEKTMMSNALAYKWSTEMGHYASRTQYVEVFLDTQNAGTLASGVTPGGSAAPTTGQTYVGIYILEEKIKISNDRVNVDEISPTNPNGGWIVAQDRSDSGAELTFQDDTQDSTGAFTRVNIIYAEPDKSDLGTVGNSEAVTIKNGWNAFVDALFSSNTTVGQRWTDASASNTNYYGNYIDVKSFVDFYLLNEMTRNIDSFWLSTYFNKAADTVVNGVTQRGLISAGPAWDFNLAFGEANYNYSGSVSGWDTDTLSPTPNAPGVSGFNPQDPYFQKLLTDPNFKLAVADRWAQLRSTYFSTPHLMADIDANVAILSNGNTNYPVGISPSQSPINDPIVRNFIRWQELGVDVTTGGLYSPTGIWDGTDPTTNGYYPSTDGDVGLMRNWLTFRAKWMDSQFVPMPTVTAGGSFGGPVAVTMTPVAQTTVSDGSTLIAPGSFLKTYFPTSAANDITNWQTLDPTNLSSSWVLRHMPIGYSTGSNDVNYNPYIPTDTGSDVGNIMRSAVTSTPANDVYVLANFVLSDASSVQGLVLRAQTDDALVVWINGVRAGEIAMTGTQNPVWNSAAPASGVDAAAITFREFDLEAIKPFLKNGNNTLAIQGENSGTGSTDFLLNPALYTRVYSTSNSGTVYYTTDGTDPRPSGGGSPTASALAYSSALNISATTHILARTRYPDGSWSALCDNLYTIGADPLRITEIMYNPPDPSAHELSLDSTASAQDFEFIEFENTGTTPLNLGGYKVTTGIVFTFPSAVTLAPGAYAVAVKDLTAFSIRYPNVPASAILGAYDSGNLNNDGEAVAFQNGNSVVVQSFTYTDAWYKTQTDGHGYSLVIRNPLDATLSDWGTVGAWRASYLVNGLPGQSDVDNTPPTVQSSSYSSGSVAVNFSELVNVTNPSNATLTDLVTGNSFNPTGFTMNGNTATFSIPTLGDGLFSFILPSTSVSDAAANQIGANVTYGMLLLAAGHVLQLPSTASTYTVNQVTMGAASTLDLKNDTLLYKGGTLGTWGGSSYSGMTGLIASGRNGGAWNGTGIISSTTTAGVFSDVGIASNAGTLTIKRTYAGDANLDGVINGDDYFQIDGNAGLIGGAVSFAAGDFDYNGKVNADDYFLIDANYSKGQTPLSAPPLALQPVQAAGAQPPKAAAMILTETSAWDRLSDDSDLL